MLNYEVDPATLESYIPKGTELDTWHGKTLVSVVAFLFLDTRVLGIPIPFHRNFVEVNLRFYVKREAENEVRRGVVFIKEIVPRFAIAQVARVVYNENYFSMPMRHRLDLGSTPKQLEYLWGRGDVHRLAAHFHGEPQHLIEGSEEQFISEHYWGYARQRDGGTVEYRVTHEPWRVWPQISAIHEFNAQLLYGPIFGPFLQKTPRSAFLAEGSPITVHKGQRLI